MMRIYKHYHLNVRDTATAATSTSFPSYPGLNFIIILSAYVCGGLQVTPGYKNLFIAHNSWFPYQAMMRIFKHYHSVKTFADRYKRVAYHNKH